MLSPSAKVTSGSPTWENGLFRQSFMVEASEAIPPECFERCFETAARMFRGSLAIAGYTPRDYAWPPTDVKADPAANMRAAMVYFETRAAKPPQYGADNGGRSH